VLVNSAIRSCRFGQLGYVPLEPVGGDRGPLVCLPGRIPIPPRLGAVLPGSIEGVLRSVQRFGYFGL
jgi:hypothetical protein